jgi:hypothetical protein
MEGSLPRNKLFFTTAAQPDPRDRPQHHWQSSNAPNHSNVASPVQRDREIIHSIQSFDRSPARYGPARPPQQHWLSSSSSAPASLPAETRISHSLPSSFLACGRRCSLCMALRRAFQASSVMLLLSMICRTRFACRWLLKGSILNTS